MGRKFLVVLAVMVAVVTTLVVVVPVVHPTHRPVVHKIHQRTVRLPASIAALGRAPTRVGGRLGGNLSCGANVTNTMSQFFNSQPANTTVVLPAGECFNVTPTVNLNNAASAPVAGIFNINGTTGLTINGQGATFNNPVEDTGATDVLHPVLFLSNNTNLTISDVNLVGPWTCTGQTVSTCDNFGGQNHEGQCGLMLQGNAGVTMTTVNVSYVEGDGLSVQIPLHNIAGVRVNTGVSFSYSTVHLVGWVSLSVEAVDGLTAFNDTFSGVGADAVDFEVDGASTFFPNASNTPRFAAQDDITVDKSTFEDFAPGQEAFWFDDHQGGIINCIPSLSTPCLSSNQCSTGSCQFFGIQQYQLSLIDNTIYHPFTPAITIQGTDLNTVPAGTGLDNRYLNITLDIEGNTWIGTTKSTSGGSPCTPNSGSAMVIKAVYEVTFKDNTFPEALSKDGACPGAAYLAAMTLGRVHTMAVDDNNFPGAYSVINPVSANDINVTHCGNTYGRLDNQTDGPCPP